MAARPEGKNVRRFFLPSNWGRKKSTAMRSAPKKDNPALSVVIKVIVVVSLAAAAVFMAFPMPEEYNYSLQLGNYFGQGCQGGPRPDGAGRSPDHAKKAGGAGKRSPGLRPGRPCRRRGPPHAGTQSFPAAGPLSTPRPLSRRFLKTCPKYPNLLLLNWASSASSLPPGST